MLLKTAGRRELRWCIVRYLKSHLTRMGDQQYRLLYSKTGKWAKVYNADKRKELEAYWQPRIQEQHRLSLEQEEVTQTQQENFYVLSMFPYPSGKLHMGHMRVYTISDVLARYNRQLGKKVIHPMGWDAFGLPAENAAIERGLMPELWTYSNIDSMKKQMVDLCYSFDWNREVATCDPEYYRWTQFIFLKMYDAGLVYQRDAIVNWDPVDKTVLAVEQIDDAGCSWRSGAKAEKRYLRQWYIKTTAYSKSLYEALDTLDQDCWNEIIKVQKYWIGECKGCRFEFQVQHQGRVFADPLSIFTDYPEAIFGLSHITLSPDHRFNQPQYYKNQEDGQKKDFVLDIEAVHPFTKVKVPLVVSNSTEFDYNNDSHIAIPCMSETDARIAAGLALETVDVFRDEILINSGEFSGLPKSTAIDAIMEYARKHNFGGDPTSQRLEDWLISRQRYWGTPIPIIHCPECKAVPVPYSDLPITLPKLSNFEGRSSSLEHCHEWLQTKCPRCGGPATRETDTMDTFVDSSWYYLRYLDPHNAQEPFNAEKARPHYPVDVYIGGKEHALLHLMYARFFAHFLYDLGLLNHKEPFRNLLTQGMVLGQTYRTKETGKYLKPEEIDYSGSVPVEKHSGAELVLEWEKMSKSKYNGVDPEAVVGEFGIDATRTCILYNVDFKLNQKWSNDAFRGVFHWQNRMWIMVHDYLTQCDNPSISPDPDLLAKWEEKLYNFRNVTIAQVARHMERTFLLNQAIKYIQHFTDTLKKCPKELMFHSTEFKRSVADLVIMVSPFMPSMASEMWAGLSSVSKGMTQHEWDASVLEQRWPAVDMDYKLLFIVQANKRPQSSVIKIPRSKLDTLTIDEAHDIVKQYEFYHKYIAGKILDIELDVHKGCQATVNFILNSEKETEDSKEKLQHHG